MRAGLWVSSLLMMASATLVSAQPGADISAPNFLRINQEFCTAGQPSWEDLAKLKAQGIKAIVNLRRPAEAAFLSEEAEKARALGLKYFNIPVDSSHPQPQQADEFLTILADEANRPMLIHCASANRVGGFWMIHRVLNDGWSFEEAEKEAQRIGLRSPVLLEFARNYVKRHRQEEKR